MIVWELASSKAPSLEHVKVHALEQFLSSVVYLHFQIVSLLCNLLLLLVYHHHLFSYTAQVGANERLSIDIPSAPYIDPIATFS